MRRLTAICPRALLAFVCALTPATPAFGQHSPLAGTRDGFVTTRDGVRIRYLEAGPTGQAGRTAPILFVPGWTMPAEIWEQQIAHFAKTRRVVAMDPRSQGLSSQASEGNYPEARARDIKAVVDQLKLAPVVLVGWSLAVKELVAYVKQFGCDTIAGLVLVDGAAGLDPQPDVIREVLNRSMRLQRDRPAAAAQFVRGMYKKPQPPEYLDRITRATLRTPTPTAIALMLEYVASDFRPDLASITKPTVIVTVRRPGEETVKDTQRRIAGAQVEVMDGVGHALFVDDPQRFNTIVEGFFKSLGPTK
ncbi:MAG: alpha/beta hydrolase [Acidobacteriia bacterium]|nr:alpha/beta hydrolase [Terriglobia bacterium]